MKFIHKFSSFNKVNENLDLESEVDTIVDTMVEFIDEGEDISFISSSGEMNYKDYLEKNWRYESFKPVMKGGNKIISKFTIIYRPKNNNYDGLINVMDNMKTCIGRLGDSGWSLVDFDVQSNRYVTARPVEFRNCKFTFEKPDVVLEEEFKPPTEDELREKVESMGIAVRDVDVSRYDATVEFSSYAYDGNLNSETWYDDKFEKVADFFGFSAWDLDYQRAIVTFEY